MSLTTSPVSRIRKRPWRWSGGSSPLLNAEADLSDLSEAARQFEENLNGVVAQNAKIAEYVAKLERKKPEGDEDAGGSDELPPAGDLVAEIEQFLRQQRPEGP